MKKKSLLLFLCSLCLVLSAVAANPVLVSPQEGMLININQPIVIKVVVNDYRATQLVAKLARVASGQMVYETKVALLVGTDTAVFSIPTFNLNGGGEQYRLELTTFAYPSAPAFLGRSTATLTMVGRPPFPPIGPLINDLPAMIVPGYFPVYIKPNNPQAVRIDVQLRNSLSLAVVYQTTVYVPVGASEIGVGLLTNHVQAGIPHSVDMVSYDRLGAVVGRSSYPFETLSSPLYLVSPADHSTISVGQPVEVKVALNVPKAKFVSVKLLRNVPRTQTFATMLSVPQGMDTLSFLVSTENVVPGEQYLLELTAYESVGSFPLKQMYYTFFTSSSASSRLVGAAQGLSQVQTRPNPFTDELWLDISPVYKQTHIRLFGQDGRLVAEKQAMGGKTVSFRTENLSAGVYVMQLHDSEGHYEQLKVVKQ